MSWRVARSLLVLRTQVNSQWPRRSHASDGTIGDAAHASRNSDHNPWVKDYAGVGVVTAMDLTTDPGAGADMRNVAEAIRESQDHRVKYMIHRGRIMSGDAGPAPWQWRTYTGPNPHMHHLHVSVKPTQGDFDNTRAWHVRSGSVVTTQSGSGTPKTGASKAKVARFQALMRVTHGGTWGPVTDRWAMRMRTAARAKTAGVRRPFWTRKVQYAISTPQDGRWGPRSQAALVKWIKRAQLILGVKSDGEWGPKTDSAFTKFRSANK